MFDERFCCYNDIDIKSFIIFIVQKSLYAIAKMQDFKFSVWNFPISFLIFEKLVANIVEEIYLKLSFRLIKKRNALVNQCG